MMETRFASVSGYHRLLFVIAIPNETVGGILLLNLPVSYNY